MRRLLLVLLVAALLVAGAYVAGSATKDGPSGRPTVTGTGGVETSTPTPSPTPTPTRPVSVETPRATAEAGVPLLSPGDEGPQVRELQARLKQIFWFEGDVTGTYGDLTTTAVRGFQRKRQIPVTGAVDRRTLDRLEAMTAEPTVAELQNRANQPGAVDARCRVGRVICVDKTSSTLRWVVDGQVLQTLDVRFGASSTPTREGVFHVYLKDADHVSRLYGSSMPLSMFFSGGQAVHYSSDFATVGYAGASHGCVNVRDYDGLTKLFGQVRVGDTVVVYWS
jgi:lipoprotein-anchoring transpeptidase ErfK/SrfK